MKVSIEEAEIHEAILNYVSNLGIDTAGKELSVRILPGRSNKTSAEITIVNKTAATVTAITDTSYAEDMAEDAKTDGTDSTLDVGSDDDDDELFKS